MESYNQSRRQVVTEMAASESFQANEHFPLRKKQCVYVPGENNGKWSEEEHMRYVVFIDYNRQKMRSKEKRRSNKFYKEMSRFISTRNALQCRSHHQKLEEKYSSVNKIITLFKPSFELPRYREAYKMLVNMPSLENKPPEKSVREVEVQTEIEGVNFSFLYMNQNTVVVQPQPFSYFMPPMQLGEACYWPSCLPSFVPEQMKLPNGMNPFG